MMYAAAFPLPSRKPPEQRHQHRIKVHDIEESDAYGSSTPCWANSFDARGDKQAPGFMVYQWRGASTTTSRSKGSPTAANRTGNRPHLSPRDGIIGMINFAHGDIYMVSAFIAVTGFTLLAALRRRLGSAGAAGGAGVAVLVDLGPWLGVERTAPTARCAVVDRLAPLISAIGMSIFLQNMVQSTQGARVKPIPPMVGRHRSADDGRLHGTFRIRRS